MRSASTARRRSTARSSANMASRRRPGAGGSRPRSERAAERADARRLPPQQVSAIAPRRDGTRLAFSAVGDGPPLVKTANWLNHIEHDWESPLWRHWLRELTQRPCLIRYDERGNGLSDWDTPEISFEAFVDDLETRGRLRRARALRPARHQPGRGGGDRLCGAPSRAGAAAGAAAAAMPRLGGARATRRRSRGARR